MTVTRVVVIATPGLRAGFAMAGVAVFDSVDGRDAARRIERLVEESPVGVVLIEDSLYSDLPDDFRRKAEREPLPVLVPIPGPNWTEESKVHEYIAAILRRAIGYRVRLQ